MATKMDEYDFIICGGGTAGCVIAGRLAEDPNTTILVLEAGQDSANLDVAQIPGAWFHEYDLKPDWSIVSEEVPGLNNRHVRLDRGKFLGGCSGCNMTLCVPPFKQDIDDWGIDGWSGEELHKYMRKAETFHPKPWFKEVKEAHGYDGQLHTEPPREPWPITNMIFESMVDRGFPRVPALISRGDIPHGCGACTRTAHNGLRSTGADFITKNRRRANVTIVCDAHVDKVLLAKKEDDDAGKQQQLVAHGVRYLTSDGQKSVEVKAKKEVIVSGGTFCSPLILNRSGIGARDELAAHGIPQALDLPGVGKNLMDHLIVMMFYEINRSDLGADQLIHHGDAGTEAYRLWRETKTGFLTDFPAGATAYTRVDERLQADSAVWRSAPRRPGRDPMGLTPGQPNVELIGMECYAGFTATPTTPPAGTFTFSMAAGLFQPQSRGTVELLSADPRVGPRVDSRYLSNPLDAEVLAEGCRIANEIATQGSGTRGIIKGSWPTESRHHLYTTREEWIGYVRQFANTFHHSSGTCRMGKADDPKAVVDEKLFVRGVKNLRVADCSIMPILGTSHTQMTAYGIGEKAADMIKAAWGVKSAK